MCFDCNLSKCIVYKNSIKKEEQEVICPFYVLDKVVLMVRFNAQVKFCTKVKNRFGYQHTDVARQCLLIEFVVRGLRLFWNVKMLCPYMFFALYNIILSDCNKS